MEVRKIQQIGQTQLQGWNQWLPNKSFLIKRLESKSSKFCTKNPMWNVVSSTKKAKDLWLVQISHSFFWEITATQKTRRFWFPKWWWSKGIHQKGLNSGLGILAGSLAQIHSSKCFLHFSAFILEILSGWRMELSGRETKKLRRRVESCDGTRVFFGGKSCEGL